MLSINDVTATEITEILDLTNNHVKLGKHLVANLFYEPSTRTRLSFELAARRVGADWLTFDADSSAERKGESLRDTALTLEALGVDTLVVRHQANGVPRRISGWVGCNVINAGDGTNEHPTQALTDLYTMRRVYRRIAGLHVGIVGDVRHSRVAHSLYLALAKMGARTTLIGPRKLVSSRPGPYVSYDLEAMLPQLDVCYMLRAQRERHLQPYDLEGYSLTPERAALLPDHGVIMHPGPMNRGVEINSNVADSARSLVQAQVRFGVDVRAALLYWLHEGRYATATA